MAAASLTPTRLPSPARPNFPRWATSQVRLTICPIYAATGGKGFGEILKRRKGDGKEQEVPVTSRSPTRGFGEKRHSKENIEAEAPLVAAVEYNAEEETTCPCGGGDGILSYDQCCMPFHQGTAAAPDSLSLLRARYSAFARGIVGFIASTTHPESPDYGDNLTANAQETCDQLWFYGLEVLHYELISDQESSVSYRVIYGQRKKGKRDRRALEEKCQFVREADTWLFKDGEVLRRLSEADLLSVSTASKAAKS